MKRSRDIFEKLQPLSRKIQSQLQQSVRNSFPVTLKEPSLYFLESPGKKIRPLLTLLCCQAVGGNPEHALSAAAGIELFHDFSLVHDDIMDQDELRRGRQTIHTKWDEGTAILVGDALIGLALENMVRSASRHHSEVIQLFSEALIVVCEGQALDKEFEKRNDLTLPEYLDMISKKTSWLFQLSCQVGAILGDAQAPQVAAFRRFGWYLGMGFQIQDDLLDFIGDEAKLGKKVGSDLKRDKKTYITLKYQEFVQEFPEKAAAYPKQLWQFENLRDLKNALFDLGLVRDTLSVAERYIRDALDNLQTVQTLDEENDLYQVVRFLQNRQY
jgi:geranylgeranyl diphosphate synthase type II